MSPKVLSRYESALASDDALKFLTATVRERLRVEGSAAVLSELEELRRLLQARDQEDREDVVLEVMDYVTGFCSPNSRLS